MSTRHDEGRLVRRRTGGPVLYFNSAFPREPARAAVGLLHGYADYSGRFTHVMDAWAERGIATVGIDMRGHGRAEGQRGYCERFPEYLDDVSELLQLMDSQLSGVPRFLFGHSFGGLVAATAVIADPAPWRGVILSAPYFDVALPVSSAKLMAGKVASRLIPRLGMRSGLQGADVTHDPVRARAYDEDPLVFKNVTSRWYTESQAAQARAQASAGSLTLPLYVVMGTGDRIAKVGAARAFFDAAGSADKTWDDPDGLFHEVLNEPEWRPIADRISAWILAHS
jgi:alpha-beta hydrolase superfamily lysophospholipase